jgi:hypothetical protein
MSGSKLETVSSSQPPQNEADNYMRNSLVRQPCVRYATRDFTGAILSAALAFLHVASAVPFSLLI